MPPIQNISKNVALYDVDSGTFLYGVKKIRSHCINYKDNDRNHLSENYQLDDVVRVSKESARSQGSVISLKEDEKITVESLLKVF